MLEWHRRQDGKEPQATLAVVQQTGAGRAGPAHCLRVTTSGKPGNIREFDSCQGNVRDFTKSLGIVRKKILSGKSCLKCLLLAAYLCPYRHLVLVRA